jgi:hypothetical protein
VEGTAVIVPAICFLALGVAVALLGLAGMKYQRAKGWGYLCYSLGLFAVGTVTMLNAPTLASICLAGLCYAFALLTVIGAAVAAGRGGEHAEQSVHEGQDDGLAPEEAGH